MARKKPKVSTKNSIHLERQKKIETLLENHPEGLTPKYISMYTRINVNTVKSILNKMPSIIQKEGLRGYYLLVDNQIHSILSYNIHNVILSFKSDKINIQERIKEVNNLNDFIKFRFEVGKQSQQATMHISSDYPFNISSLSILSRLFIEFITKHCNITPSVEEINVKTLEFNRDFYNCKLEGINSITLDSLLFQFKLYEKKNCVREEYKSKIPIDLPLLLNLLKQGMTTAETIAKIKSQDKEISKINNKIESLGRFSRMHFNKKFKRPI